MGKKIGKYLVLFILFSFFLQGCYYTSVKDEMANAEKSFAALKAAGGEKLVPYEYTSAEKFLELSKMEFAVYDYNDAKRFAGSSISASGAGLAEIKKK